MIYFFITAVLMICFALMGHCSASRYKEKITETYHKAVGNVTEKIDDIPENLVQ